MNVIVNVLKARPAGEGSMLNMILKARESEQQSLCLEFLSDAFIKVGKYFEAIRKLFIDK